MHFQTFHHRKQHTVLIKRKRCPTVIFHLVSCQLVWVKLVRPNFPKKLSLWKNSVLTMLPKMCPCDFWQDTLIEILEFLWTVRFLREVFVQTQLMMEMMKELQEKVCLMVLIGAIYKSAYSERSVSRIIWNNVSNISTLGNLHWFGKFTSQKA